MEAYPYHGTNDHLYQSPERYLQVSRQFHVRTPPSIEEEGLVEHARVRGDDLALAQSLSQSPWSLVPSLVDHQLGIHEVFLLVSPIGLNLGAASLCYLFGRHVAKTGAYQAGVVKEVEHQVDLGECDCWIVQLKNLASHSWISLGVQVCLPDVLKQSLLPVPAISVLFWPGPRILVVRSLQVQLKPEVCYP